MQEQKKLIQTIIEELKVNQSILEYGRVLLDRDKEIRNKYKWINIIENKITIPASFVFEGITFVATLCKPIAPLIIFTVFGLIILVFILVFRYKYREDIKLLINKKDKEDIKKHLDIVNNYLFQLDKWITDLDYIHKRESAYINDIRSSLKIEKNKVVSIENTISELYGKIDSELEIIAQNHASERLAKYSKYVYEQES